MVFLKLLGYAVGSVVMYWGFLLLLIAPWLLAVLLILLINAAWNQVTGKNDEWTWLVDWSDTVMKVIHRCKFEWVGWIPGSVIQIWYAGYAANLVYSSALAASRPSAIALQGMGVVGVVVAVAVFSWLYIQVVEVHWGLWMYFLIGGVSLGAYFVLLQQPQVAAVLSASWQRVFTALLTAALESL